MQRIISGAIHLANRATRWWSGFILLILLIAIAMLLMGTMEADLEFIDGVPVNPYLGVIIIATLLIGIFYLIVFALALPMVYLWSLFAKTNNKSEE